ncbi:MAG: magnesium chelatase subunit D [Pseudomonadota bacterium]
MPPWARISGADYADRALAIFAIAPKEIGGLWIRARAGPVMDRVVLWLRHALEIARVPPTTRDEDLFCSFDLGQALSSGTITPNAGLLDRSGTILMPMAERCPKRLAAHLGAAIDDGTHAVIALDEGFDGDELPPDALTERLGLFLDLSHQHNFAPSTTYAALTEARERVLTTTIGPDEITELVIVAAQLGISSLRAPLSAVAIAKAHAALLGRNRVESDDLIAAAQLAFGHLASMTPEASEQPPPPEMEAEAGDIGEDEMTSTGIPSDMIVEAALSALPRDVLQALADGRAARTIAAGSGSGAIRKGSSRGRPLPSRRGVPADGARIDTVATLRAALPWQKIRGRASPDEPLRFRKSDLHHRVYQERTDRLLIFTVDASGSQAMTRLAEAKGAVEILLAEAYARRDQVALVAFRGQTAELLLPPTRSLVQTKRRLSGLPGGGGTPLAAGLQEALSVALGAQAKGMSPTLVLMTDGRSNIALDGQANRAQADADAQRMARLIAERGIASLVVDTGLRVSKSLTELASTLGGDYIAMPRADARRLSAIVSDSLDS